MAVFNLGGVIRAFSPDKVVRKPLFEPLDANFTDASGRTSRIAKLNEADEANFASELARVRPEVRRIGTEDIATLGGQINRLGRTSAMDQYRSIGDYQKSLIDSVAEGLANRGMAKLNLRRANLGYGGRGGGSFDTAKITNLISQNLAPVYSQAFSGIGRDLGAVNQADLGNLNALLTTIGERAGIPLRGLDLYRLGSDFRLGNQAGELANLASLVNSVRAGTAGFEKKTNKWADAVSAVDEGLNSALDMAMSLYGGGMLGGMGGGGAGGGAGGIGSILGGMGGGGGGGGGDIISMLSSFIGGGGGGKNSRGNFSDIFSYAPQSFSAQPYTIPQLPAWMQNPTINPYAGN